MVFFLTKKGRQT